jgi:hypothetical protein
MAKATKIPEFPTTQTVIDLPAERGGGTGRHITCGCPRHNGMSAVMRDPGHDIDRERIHHFVEIANHPVLGRAQSTQKFGPWKA